MEEIAPGLWHWTARHPRIRSDVSSYYLAGPRILIDPLLPSAGLGWFLEDAGSRANIRHRAPIWWIIQDACEMKIKLLLVLVKQ